MPNRTSVMIMLPKDNLKNVLRFITTICLSAKYANATLRPTKAVIVVAAAAPSIPYLGIKKMFKKTETGTKDEAKNMLRPAFPNPFSIEIIITNNPMKLDPQTNKEREFAAIRNA